MTIRKLGILANFMILSDFYHIETRMSKALSGVRFCPFHNKNFTFFFLDVVEIRATRRLKAEIVYFQKIKFSKPIEYSTPVEYSTKFHLWVKNTA